jgi:hypothetical protein
MKTVEIRNQTSPGNPSVVKMCDTFFSRLLGLMFSKPLSEEGGIVMDEKTSSKMNSAIHMLFVSYPLAVLWLDPDLVVVDKVLAKPWALAYVPKAPAQWVVELHASRLDDFTVGDQLTLTEV